MIEKAGGTALTHNRRSGIPAVLPNNDVHTGREHGVILSDYALKIFVCAHHIWLILEDPV